MIKDGGKLLRKHTASVHNRAYPPQVDEAEVIADPVNDPFFNAWGKKANGSNREPQRREEVTRENIAEIIRAAQEGNKLDPKMVEWLESMANARDELAGKLAQGAAKSLVDDLTTLAKALKGHDAGPCGCRPCVAAAA